jgi:hypothetical protein
MERIQARLNELESTEANANEMQKQLNEAQNELQTSKKEKR